MQWLRGFGLVMMCGVTAAACSAEPEQPSEPVGSVAQAITTACNTDTIGLPCDPDGPGGPKLECEGACYFTTTGIVACVAVTTGVLDGVICGTTNGVGDNACKRYCSGKTCLSADAPAGAACRPTTKSNPCEGQCDGAGKCDNLGGQACAYGRDEQLCKLATCDFANSSQCLTKNLARNTLCSDQDACSIGKCSAAGVCVAGPTVGCDDGNACTDDSCDPNDGGCLGVKDDTNACSDGNACFTGEHCSDGSCVPGTVPVVCNDGNACTDDSCDPNTGCAFVAKSCSDGDACTQDDCDPASGSCSHSAITCNDDDLCTTDSCSSATGCVYTPLDCNDNDACTVDSCGGGTCAHAAVSCDDNDACTADSCDSATGCAHTPIPDCGAGGAGGAGNQGGAAGAENSAGADNAAGSPAGSAGEGGEAAAGAPSSGGSQSQAGSAGSTSSGTGNGGNPGGASAGGTGAGAGEGPSGGPTNNVNESTSCGCRAVGSRTPTSSGAWLALLFGLFVRRRRPSV